MLRQPDGGSLVASTRATALIKGRTAAIGATAGFDFKAGDIPISTRVRYYREVDAKNRLKDDRVFLSLSMPLWVQGAGR